MIIRLSDYRRIYQILTAIIESEELDSTHACVCYSFFGAIVLRDHFRVEPKVCVGFAAYCLSEDGVSVAFWEEAVREGKVPASGFHCWIEVDGWAIDFMAPRFGDLVANEISLEPAMFQRRLNEMNLHANSLRKVGEFCLRHEDEWVDEILRPVIDHPGWQDLANHASGWFKKPPKKIPTAMASVGSDGKLRPIEIRPISIRPRW